MESKRIRFRMCEVCERNEFLTEEKIKEALATLSDKVIKYCYIFPLNPPQKTPSQINLVAKENYGII